MGLKFKQYQLPHRSWRNSSHSWRVRVREIRYRFVSYATAPYQYASHPSGSILVDGQEVIGLCEEELLKVRGGRIGMIFQEPMTSLNPLHHIEKQIGEVLYVHQGMGISDARARSLELLEMVGLQRAKDRRVPIPMSSPVGSVNEL